MLKMCIFDRFFINIVSFKLFTMQLKISKEKIKSFSVEDFLKNVVSTLVENYSLAEYSTSPRLQCINSDDFNEVFVKIATKDELLIDAFADIICYCNFYFDTKRATVVISGSSVNSGFVLYTVILFKD